MGINTSQVGIITNRIGIIISQMGINTSQVAIIINRISIIINGLTINTNRLGSFILTIVRFSSLALAGGSFYDIPLHIIPYASHTPFCFL